MPEVAFALIVGFIVGLLVGYLMRNESRQFEADLGSHEDAEH
jgi:multisubunit Na+/H+ antiporter MnhE subunit